MKSITWFFLRKNAASVIRQARSSFQLDTRKFSSGSKLTMQRQPAGLVADYLNLIAEGVGNSSPRVSFRAHIATNNDRNRLLLSKGKRIFVNLEHTLVVPGGRGSDNSPAGATPVEGDGDSLYLARLAGNQEVIRESHSVVDYSLANIHHIDSSPLRGLYEGKSVYIAPLLRDEAALSASGRDYSSIYTMMNLAEPDDRRARIIHDLSLKSGLAVHNISNLRSGGDSRLARIGILLNLHQTDHHHTLEELRILPALMAGVLVVSEPSPLIEVVPYSKFIRFASESQLPSVLSDLTHNFESEWHRTFVAGGFAETLKCLKRSNDRSFKMIASSLYQ